MEKVWRAQGKRRAASASWGRGLFRFSAASSAWVAANAGSTGAAAPEPQIFERHAYLIEWRASYGEAGG